jgi:hypothetical protein
MDFITAEMKTPNEAQPHPATKAMKGTTNMPHDGSSPKTMATNNGTQPKTPERAAIQRHSPVTSSSVSTGAARMAL